MSTAAELERILEEMRSVFARVSPDAVGQLAQEIVNALRRRNHDVAYCELPSHYGHDAFLVEVGELDPDGIHVPSVYVKRIFQGGNYQKWIEKRTVSGAPAKGAA